MKNNLKIYSFLQYIFYGYSSYVINYSYEKLSRIEFQYKLLEKRLNYFIELLPKYGIYLLWSKKCFLGDCIFKQAYTLSLYSRPVPDESSVL